MKNMILLVALFAAFALITCNKDNPTEPEPQKNNDLVTQNIKETPTFFSLSQKKNVTASDLEFVNDGRTVGVYLNGGVSGSAGVTAKNLGVVDFNAAANTDTGFISDADGAFVIGENWYNYDPVAHTLSSKGEVYLIKAVDYNIYKMIIESFDSGYTIRYALVDGGGMPTATKNATIAASQGAPGYFSLSTDAIVEQDQWDVAFLTIPLYVPELGTSIQNPGMRINSAAGVEIATVENMTFENVQSVPTGLTYQKDVADSLAIGDKVFNYNPENHRLTPPDVVYIVKTMDGKHAKLKVTAYYHPETGDSGYVNFVTEMLD